MYTKLKMVQRLLWIVVALCIGCASNGSVSPNSNSDNAQIVLTVFAAASLTDVFTELGHNFSQQNPSVELVFNFAGSNQLATQIGEGAPADLYASANPVQMIAAIESGRIAEDAPQTFAQNRLTVILPSDNPAHLQSLLDLAKPNTKLVLAAAEVPAGQYAREFLERAAADSAFGPAYQNAVAENVVSYEANVRGVLSKVRLGEADAGIVYLSDVANSMDEILMIDIPATLNPTATYMIAPLVDSLQLTAAEDFVAYVLSAEGQQVFSNHGFDAGWQ